MSVSTESTAEVLRRQMEIVRRELHSDAEGVVDTAKELGDWKHYVKSYPWVCVGAAAAIGYMLVPQKVTVMRPTSDQLAVLARKQQLVVEPSSSATNTSTWKGKALTLVSNLALRAALAYVGQQFGKAAGVEAAEATDPEPAFSRYGD